MEQANRQISIQEYLSLGYVYLIVLGILRDVIYYKFFGLNILNYSGVLDILLSPVTILFKDIWAFLVIVITLGLSLFFFQKYLPKQHKKNRTKAWYIKKYDVAKLDKSYAQSANFNSSLFIIAFMSSSMYLGLGIGAGGKLANRIKTNSLEMDHKLSFTTGEEAEVRIIGQNSTYLFYISENEQEVSIVPIATNIQKIQKLPKK